MKCIVTHTDTYGGEANYGWVKRHMFDVDTDTSQRTVVRRAKVLANLTGVKSETYDYGDSLTIKPRGYAQVVFVDFE